MLEVLNGTETLVLVGAQDLLTPAEHSRRCCGASQARSWRCSTPAATW